MLRWKLARLLVAGSCLAAPVALAEATVSVELKDPAGQPTNGTVELKKGELKLQCTTDAGVCQIPNVPGGLYTVTVTQPGKPSPKPTTAMIPPEGTAKLVVRGN